ncbi:hypothetical protein LTR04_004810 [Oleoguttula sp. CCFEE 6159]|nr:hypothetical protein LTR04_004810 [Oleoguttula sp. CCFEE 6159]
MPETQYFSHDLHLSDSRTTFPAKLAYWTFGDASKPAVLLPTCYGGTLENTLPSLYSGEGAVISPERYYVVVCGLLGGSESSSPSNTAAPFDGPNFPHTTYEDNIRLQHALCRHLGVRQLHAYVGFSMGGQQAYHAAALFPDFAQRVVVLAGSARTSWHNWSFLEGPKAALVNSVDWHDGRYTRPVRRGTRAFARVYSTWALSQAWFRQRCWEQLGFADLPAYLEAWWSGMGDAHDLLCLLWTWQHGDITAYHPEDGGDLAKALARIEARVLLVPSRTDMYFPPEDSEEEVKHLRRGELRVIESVWGHLAGGGNGTEEDTHFIQEQVGRWLET